MNSALCLIPAKGSSTRLPRKNLLPLGDKPMIVHALEKAVAADCFDSICVSTEDDEIAEISKQYGAEVPFVRPDSLSRDPATIVDVMLHALEQYESAGKIFEQLCVLLPTTPFVTVGDIKSAMRLFEDSGEPALLSVCETEYPPYNTWLVKSDEGHEILEPCFPDSPYKYTKSTECPRTYRSNGALLFVVIDSFVRARGYRGANIVPYIMPAARSVDIDTQDEYLHAKYLYETRLHNQQSEV